MQVRGIALLLGLVYLTSRIKTQTYNGHFSTISPSSSKCLDLTVCPNNSRCIDVGSNYYCSCNPGFILASGHSIFTNPNEKCEDVDECADSTVCPPYSKCVNSPGNYTCICKSGFVMRTKKSQGTGLSMTECQDVDECSQHPYPCGRNTKCTNSIGRYTCSCLLGFSSPGGNSWIPGRTGPFQCIDINECLNETACPQNSTCQNKRGSYDCTCSAGFTLRNSQCEDVDECADSTVCPPYSKCINSPGNYTCICKSGFIMRTRKSQGTGLSVTECQDVDECSQHPYPCGRNTKCTNSIGRYTCSCLLGFSSPGGNSWIPGRTGPFRCIDINECLNETACPQNSTCQNKRGSYDCTCSAGFTLRNSQCEDKDECMNTTACPTHATCTNTPGSYFCTCKHGYKSSTSEVNFRGHGTQCRKIPARCKAGLVDEKRVRHCQSNSTVLPEHNSFCMLTDSICSVLEDSYENQTTTVSLEKAAENLASVLEETSTWQNLSQEGTSTLATAFLNSVESVILASFVSLSGNTSQTVTNEYLEIKSKVIQDDCLMENLALTLSAKGDSIKIECSTIHESVSLGTLSGITGVAFTSFLGMESILDENFFYSPEVNLIKYPQKLQMNSRVVGGIITGVKKDNFSNPIIYILENLKPKKRSDTSICISWDPEIEGGRWTRTGCVMLHSSETKTTCSCNHLANMAVIMAPGETTMDFALFLISHVGMILSLLCLALAIATFLLCRSIQNRNTTFHLHLCVCLFLAKLLFLVGVDKTENETVCSIIAGLLHYLFLACFAWMLVEAMMLFLMVRNLKVVNYFSSRSIKMLYLCAIGYGLPGLIVAVAAGSQWGGYGTYKRCWLNTDTGFIWSFLGPVCTIIMINSVLLTWTLWILRKKLSSVNAEVSTLKDNRLLTFKAFAQFLILGSSWILGIFQIGPIASIMAYLFTIINSLQGTFIFIIHCVLNHQVREEYKRCFTGKAKSNATSQMTGILLSPIPSTSKSV